MSEQVVTYIIENEIAIVTINNPPMNPLTALVKERLLLLMDLPKSWMRSRLLS